MEFHHHPDNIIYLRSDQGDYHDALANFLLDIAAAGLTYSGLPVGAQELRYIPGTGVLAYKNGDQEFVGLETPELQAILANIDTIKNAQAKREAASRTVAPTEPTEAERTSQRIEAALAYLSKTDGMAVRQLLGGEAMPAAVKAARDKAYAMVPAEHQISIPKVLAPSESQEGEALEGTSNEETT